MVHFYSLILAGWIAIPGQCSIGFGSDSFGRGVKFAFTGREEHHQHDDGNCFALGTQWAQTQIGQHFDDHCRSCFRDAYHHGLANDGDTSPGTVCAVAGYLAGQADLNIGAREGDTSLVGADCVRAYQTGAEERREGLANSPYDIEGLLNQYCYRLGWSD